ncbi:hypothetical protein BDN71DRAFT_1439280 [Pleurotus eryngii]|uniref:Transmembrane protein n=1 Tax=Pleurotus eryngii TaxID=5323 RepID=A0A9P6DCG4_PLEER|nr:hypothetical protein BDN71DRAFT_1439280 [Pleurotus eryngii]
MAPSFRLIRRCLLSTLLILYTGCFSISLAIHRHVLHGNALIAVAFESAIAALCCAWVLLRKSFTRRAQLIGYETTMAFTILPFELVLVLILLSLKPTTRAPDFISSVLFGLQIVTYVKTALLASYCLFLITVSIIVAYKFDRLIWIRDIDESPSPFPPSVVLAFLLPWRSYPSIPASSSAFDRGPQPYAPVESRHFCLPDCTCTSKQLLTAPQASHMSSQSTSTSTEASSTMQSDTQSTLSKLMLKDEDLPEHRIAGSSSLSRSLIRIPNDYERRCSIEVSL